MVDLTISIATENNERLLAECLDSIYKSIKNISLEIYIIDNSPNDRTKEMLAGKFPDVNVVSPLAVNNFASNHNQILKIASGKNVVILNDDTIIKVGAFDKMHRYLIEHPEAGIAGPRIINTDGSYRFFLERAFLQD